MDFLAPAADRAAALPAAVNQFGDPIIGQQPASSRVARDMGEAFKAGFQDKTLGLMLRGKLPDTVLDQESPWYHRAAAGFGGLISDAPAMIAGGAAGGAAGSAVAPGPGTLIGAGAGSFAVPMAVREALIQAYSGGHATSLEGAWEIAKAGLKGAVIGGATMGVGGAVGRAVGSAVAPGVGVTTSAASAVRTIEGAALAAELTTMTTTAAALDGHVPTAQDFMDNAILLGGLKGAVAVAGKMRSIYAETGKSPQEVVVDAARNPELKAELQGEAALPAPPPQGLVRMYHGGSPEGVTGKLWFTSSLQDAEGWASRDKNMKVWYVDVPEKVLGGDLANGIAPLSRVELGPEFANLRKPFEPQKVATSEIPITYAPLATEQKVKAAIRDSLDNDPRPALIGASINEAVAAGKGATPTWGDRTLTDPVRAQYLDSADVITGTRRVLADAYEKEINKETRGVVTNMQTAAEAVKLVVGGEAAQKILANSTSAAEGLASAHMLRTAAAEMKAASDAIAAVSRSEVTPAMLARQQAAVERMALTEQVMSGNRAEAGRALQIWRAMKNNSNLFAEMNQLLAEASRKGDPYDFAKFVSDTAKDPAQLAKLAEQYVKPTFMQKLMFGWRSFVLSGLQTHLANMLGNAGKWLVDVPESFVAASLTALQRKMAGDPLNMAQFKARAFAPVIGFQLGTMDGLKLAGDILRRGNEAGNGKTEQYGPRPIEGKVGLVLDAPYRALQAEDALLRVPAQRAKAYELAVDRVSKEGLHPDTAEFRQKVVEYTNTPELGLSEKAAAKALETIENAGAEAVFSQRLGPFMETMQGAIARHAPIVGFVIPFVRTPTNLVSWAVQHTPGLNLMSARWHADFAAGGEARAKAMARVVVGGGLALAAYSAFQQGLITGGGLFDKEQQGTKQAAGWQPYSVKIGDKYYSYQRLEPVAKVMGLAADFHEMLDSKKLQEGDAAKVAGMLVLMFGNATVSTTYLSGLSDTMNAIADPDRYGPRLFEGYATSLVPKIIGQSATMADPYKREVDGVLDAIQSQLPYFREQLVAKRDRWGEQMKNEKLFTVMPIAVTQAANEKVKTEAMRLQVAIADAPKYVEEKGPFKASEKRTELTIEQKDVYRAVSGGAALEILRPIVNDPSWKEMPDFVQAAIFEKVIRGTRKQGEYAALPPDAAARNQVREKILNEIVRQSQAVK